MSHFSFLRLSRRRFSRGAKWRFFHGDILTRKPLLRKRDATTSCARFACRAQAARGCLIAIAAQRSQRLLDKLAAQLFFLLRRHLGVADDVDDTVTEYDPVGADHFGDRQRCGDLHGGDAGFFQFGCNRSAAASARTSRRCKNDRVDAQPFCFLGHLPPHAPGIGQRIG